MTRWDQFGSDYDHPPYEGDVSTYLIATTPRSGSHYLGHLLLRTGVLGSPLEYFHPRHVATWKKKLDAGDETVLYRALFRRRTSPSGWFGAKAHWPHFERILQSRDLFNFLDFKKYIYITREDRISQAVSFAIAQQTSSWISFKEGEAEPKYNFNQIERAIVNLDRQTVRWKQFFYEAGVTPLEVRYESLVQDPSAVIEQVLLEFGLESFAGEHNSQPQPEKQASSMNVEWKHRFIEDGGTAL